MKKVWFMILVVSALSHLAYPEVRTWKTKDGRTYEAEFVHELFDKLTLRTASGEEVRIPVDAFSEHDQKYIRVKIPPVMELDFRKATSIKPKPPENSDPDSDVITILSGKVTIKKKSNRTFTSRLKAELFLIGREVQDGDFYILLSKTESFFLLGEHNNDEHVFQSSPIELQVYTAFGVLRRGPEYRGYLIAVSDMDGNIVHVETNISWLADKVSQLQALYSRGSASVYSRYFDKETITKQSPPPPPPNISRRY